METMNEADVARAAALDRVRELAREFLAGLPERSVGARQGFDAMVAALGAPLADKGIEPEEAVSALARAVEPGLVASAGPRYFGFVIGGSLPAAVAADWLTSAWDQNSGLTATSPAAAAASSVVAGWVKELLGLPKDGAVGFVSGCQMANFSGLAAGRHAVLARAGWDVEKKGLQGAPEVHVAIGEEAHATIVSALRMLGLGEGRAHRVAVDGQGRMRPDALEKTLAPLSGPILVAAQAGNVSTGAFDAIDEIAPIVHAKNGWLHVDGAFGLWAAAAPKRRHLTRGLALADSWATDGHKWLNVPYDSGLVIVREPENLKAALTKSGAYLIRTETARDNHDYTPESSQRARAFVLWATLRSLGREGVGALVERCCSLATRFAERLRAGGVVVLNDVVINQVLVRFEPPAGVEAAAFTKAVVARVQQGGVTWASGTSWHGQECLRISVSNWSTTEADIDRSAEAILAAFRSEAAGR